MAYYDNQRLYDVATRIQLYTDGVKAGQQLVLSKVMIALREQLKIILRRTNYKSLDLLTKKELNDLIFSIRKVQGRAYSIYTQQVLDMLQAFMDASIKVNRTSYGGVIEDKKNPSIAWSLAWLAATPVANATPVYGIPAVTSDTGKLWSSIKNAPIPANGSLIKDFLKAFSVSAQSGVENIIRKAWANGWTIEQTIEVLTGEKVTMPSQGTSSQFDRIVVQSNAVIGTLMQHVASMVMEAVQSAVFLFYLWVSIMDNRTTEICISRNGKKYRYGQGPIPPAHILCRSHISPYEGNDTVNDETLYEWAQRQPSDVVNDIFGDGASNLSAKDFKNRKARPLSISDFVDKISDILQ